MTPDERAARAADAMWANDRASQAMGMEIVAVSEGAATLALIVREDHLNGHGICHGGITFALADSAFAFACNSRNQSTVALHNAITYLAVGRLGWRLEATAREVSLSGRNGIYDVTVTGPEGVIAQFRGQSRAVKGHLFEEDA